MRSTKPQQDYRRFNPVYGCTFCFVHFGKSHPKNACPISRKFFYSKGRK